MTSYAMPRAPMTTRPMMNRPQAPMNRAQAPMVRQQGIAALLAAAAAKNPQSQMTGIGAGMQQLQPVRQDLSSMFTPEQLQKLRQVTGVPVQQAQQVPMGMPFQAGAVFDPSLSSNPMQTATPLDALRPYNPMQTASPLGGVMGIGQVMGNQMGLYGQGGPMDYMGPEPGVLRPQPGNQGYSGPQQAPQGQMGMLANLSQMFNSMGGQQPAQQGGTPLQNNSSPLQQSAQPGMGLGQAMGGVMNPGLM